MAHEFRMASSFHNGMVTRTLAADARIHAATMAQRSTPPWRTCFTIDASTRRITKGTARHAKTRGNVRYREDIQSSLVNEGRGTILATGSRDARNATNNRPTARPAAPVLAAKSTTTHAPAAAAITGRTSAALIGSWSERLGTIF